MTQTRTMLEIDGSAGEGGGQILRTALGLSMVTGRPFHITGIRANRSKPGLMRQHLTGVLAAAAVCAGDVVGAEVGSRQLTFTPGPVRAGEYAFAVGTAGSVTLVLQAILPALLTAEGPSKVTIDGGTHAAHAPPVDFVCDTLLPVVRRTGADVQVRLVRHGFYPAGGGRIVVDVVPKPHLRPIRLDDGGAAGRRLATAVVAALPGSIAERELDVVAAGLGWTGEQLRLRQVPADEGPGNVLMLTVACDAVTETFTGFGARGMSAEAVAESAVTETKRYLTVGAPVGPWLADQLLVFLPIAGGGSFVTGPLSTHATTNVETIRRFLPVRFAVDPAGGERVRVAVGD
jgi:RNA 3'-terminal phosphate cyclase (ATP)